MKTSAILKIFASAVVLCAASACSSLNMNRISSAIGKSAQAMSLTNSQVAQYVKTAVAQMDAQNQVAPASSKYTQRLARLTSGMDKVGSTPLNFKVYITSQVNAFACADGSVRVYSGIMDLMNDDELLGIIGHEIGHVANEDSKDAFKQALFNSAMLDVVGSASNTMAALTDSQLGVLASEMMSAKYSRKQENEADAYGYQFLKQHGRNPYYMVMAFEKIQALESKSGSKATGNIANMFSSHPETAERIARITKMCQADSFTRPSK